MTEEVMEQMMNRIAVNYASDRDVKNLETSISKVFLDYIDPPSSPRLHKLMVETYSWLIQATIPEEGVI